jgi:NAD(P)-dependent dehydrogenase (short-subunit alcohol dehydrogenase family)
MTATALVIGGTSGLGRAIAQRCAERGERVVIAGRDVGHASRVATELGNGVTGLGVDLAEPRTIGPALDGIDRVDHLVITAADTSSNPVSDYDVATASHQAILKLVGYTETVHVLAARFRPSSSVVLFGGYAMMRPYPGSTMVTAANGGVSALIRTLAVELAPVRVNAVHPGLVGDSPRWIDKDTSEAVARTPIGRLVTMAEVASAVLFLLDNGGMNGVNLSIDGGILVR